MLHLWLKVQIGCESTPTIKSGSFLQHKTNCLTRHIQSSRKIQNISRYSPLTLHGLLAFRWLQNAFLTHSCSRVSYLSGSAQIFKLLSGSWFTLPGLSVKLPDASSYTSGYLFAPEQLANTVAVGCKIAPDTGAAKISALCSRPSVLVPVPLCPSHSKDTGWAPWLSYGFLHTLIIPSVP